MTKEVKKKKKVVYSIKWKEFKLSWFVGSLTAILGALYFLYAWEPNPFKSIWIGEFTLEQYAAVLSIPVLCFTMLSSVFTSYKVSIGKKYITSSKLFMGFSIRSKMVRLASISRFYSNKTPKGKDYTYQILSIMDGGVVTEIGKFSDRKSSRVVLHKAKASLENYRLSKSKAKKRALRKRREAANR